MLCLGRPYHLKFFKSYLPQILFGPFLNTFAYMRKIDVNVIYFQRKDDIFYKRNFSFGRTYCQMSFFSLRNWLRIWKISYKKNCLYFSVFPETVKWAVKISSYYDNEMFKVRVT